MEDKNKNVNLDNQTATVLAQAVAEEMGEIPEVSITIEELNALERADRKKRNGKRVKVVGIAAALLLVCGVAAYAAWPGNLAEPVDADKNTAQHVQEENGSVVINENDAEGKGVVTYTETNWDKVVDMRSKFPELIIPEYVPDGYEFVQLEVEHYMSKGYRAKYVYQTENAELLVEENTYQEEGESAPVLAGTEEQFETKKGKGYIVQETDNKTILAVIYSNGKSISIKGIVNENECIKIINEIDMP